ncbi:MAG: protein-disulfide reductase DsbD family protein, partial [Planctomycetota bacterium]
GSLGKAIDMEAAFRIPAVIWGLAGLFLVLGAGMLGFFELQPPAWMERMRGGAARKGGTVVGTFLLGCLAALIASPCTGPFVVAMLTFVATTGSVAIGFLIFFALGLGMGAVFFAAGSLNLLARPGPWMVWVRNAFGIVLVGLALYYVANSELLLPPALFVVGFVLALLGWWGVTRHLARREGERPRVALTRGAIVAVLIAATTGLVAGITRPVPDLGWTRLKDIPHLRAKVAEARAKGQPVLVDVWATWCFYCKEFDKVMEGDRDLRARVRKMMRLKIDVTGEDKHEDLRRALGIPLEGQPRMVLIDAQGRIRRAADVERWFGKAGEDPAEDLRKRFDLVFKDPPKKSEAKAGGASGAGS